MKRNKRRLIIVGIIVVVGTTAGWFVRCYGIFGLSGPSVYIGEYESKDTALRVAIPRLASLLRMCPCSDVYRVIWRGPDPNEDQRVGEQALLYDRKWKNLGYEHDVESGISGKVYIVDEGAIRAVAEKGGTLEDFSEYVYSKQE